ncbi:MAG: class I SAM-dependent methyltransferase [Syntrophaceae bacterium]|nr:class I SAM-dependent methyltransferase [Syntrophaceae bacterium]
MMPDDAGDNLLEERKSEIQEEEYRLPYHYKDVFAPGQSIERNSIFTFIVETFRRAGKEHVIDVGCGDGRFCFFAKDYLRVEGLDISKRALEWARMFNPEVAFHNKRIEDLNLQGEFDGAVALEVLEHIPDDGMPAFIKGIRSVVTDDAVVIFTVPSVRKPLEEKHFRHYTEMTLRETLEPFFEKVAVTGHSRVSPVHSRIFSAMNILSLICYSDRFCWKYPRAVDVISRAKECYWRQHLQEGPPETCRRLIAVCRP